MKRKILLVVLTIVMIFSLAFHANGDTFIRVSVDGKVIAFPDAQPFIDASGRTQVPARFVSQALGGAVSWNAALKTVTIIRGEDTITLTIGESRAFLNNVEKKFDTKALIKNDRSFVPLRFVSETLGAKVEWHPDTSTVEITNGLEDRTENGTQNINGYIVPVNTGSGLVVEGRTVNGKSYPEISMMASTYDGDIDVMIKEMENILLSKFNKDIVERVMQYARQKTSEDCRLQRKDFESGDRIITVIGLYNNPLNILVYVK